MNEKNLSDALGGIKDDFVTEAMDFKNERRITMSKKKIVLTVVAAVIIMTLVLPVYGAVKQYESIIADIGYFASLEDGTAVEVPPGSVNITAEKAGDNTVKFVIDADKSVYPFNEYSDLTITAYSLLIKKWDDFMPYYGRAYMPDPNWKGKFDGSVEVEGLVYEQYVRDNDLYFVKKPSNGKYAQKNKYILEVGVLYGRNADGNFIEIRGSWMVSFKM